MKKELDEALVRDFPNLYTDRDAPRHNTYTLMQFGFAIGDGWEPLLRKASQKLEELIMQLPEQERSKYRAVQVKQKFGGLRFYMSHQTPEMTEVIRQAEEEAEHTCENCGKPGNTTNTNHWLQVECDRCLLLK